jgi:hypothetical protein
MTYTLTAQVESFSATLTLYADDNGLREIPLTVEVRPAKPPAE